MTDTQLQQNVQSALGSEPRIDSAAIGVTASHGIVTLHGWVTSYSDRVAAEQVALSVEGARAVANDLIMRLQGPADRSDADIAEAVVCAFRWNRRLMHQHVFVTVCNGWVTLQGRVAREDQQEAASRALRGLTGVRGVINRIVVSSPEDASSLRRGPWQTEPGGSRSAQTASAARRN
jgi:osmotically-inducible protein OsmY